MQAGFKNVQTFKTEDIHMRDPFVFSYEKERKYFLFGTTFSEGCGDKEPMFEVYESDDLKLWKGPYIAFQPPEGFWGVRNYWAPEVFAIEDRFYLFGSFKGGIGMKRGTGILVADHPAGPYDPHSNGPVTPTGQECLDGTYFEDSEGQRWLIFCHEWTEIYEGKIKAIRLTQDLKRSYGEPIEILNAARMPWIRRFRDPRIEKEGYLTDAPFMYRAKNGSLIMLWSSYSIPGYFEKEKGGGYVIAAARSVTGSVEGPWTQDEQLLLDQNAGHPSLFRSFGNQLYLCSHFPDTPHGSERPLFIDVNETSNGLEIK